MILKWIYICVYKSLYLVVEEIDFNFLALWDSATKTSDSLLARLAVVHMVFEARLVFTFHKLIFFCTTFYSKLRMWMMPYFKSNFCSNWFIVYIPHVVIVILCWKFCLNLKTIPLFKKIIHLWNYKVHCFLLACIRVLTLMLFGSACPLKYIPPFF